MIRGAAAITVDAPTRTTTAASSRSRSTRRRAASVSPAASARATTGKLTVHSISDRIIGICATFCA